MEGRDGAGHCLQEGHSWQRTQPVQRPWGWTKLDASEEQQGGQQWNCGSEGEGGRRGKRKWAGLCEELGFSSQNFILGPREGGKQRNDLV